MMRTFPERETTVSYSWYENEDPYDLLRRVLAEYSITTGTLGIEEHTQYAFANGFARACPDFVIVDEAHACVGTHKGRGGLRSPQEA